MGTQIIVQEDGKYGLWSTISDRIWAFDCDEEQMVQLWKERAARRAEEEMRAWINDVRQKRDRYALTLKKALSEHKFFDPKLATQEEVDFDQEIKKLKKRKLKE